MSAIMNAAGAVAYLEPGQTDTVTLSGEVTIAFSFGGNADAHLKIDNDGNVYEQTNFGGYNQVDSATDWVRPTTSSPGLYEVRFTNLTGDALYTSTTAVNVWHDMTTGDWILRQRAPSNTGLFSSTLTIEIRENGGAVLDSASYTLTAESSTT